MKYNKNKLITIIIIIFSFACGLLSKDYYLGFLILMFGLLNSYYASIGKIYNYIFGVLYYILSGFVCFKNGLNGIGILSFFVFIPSQIQGYLSWNKNIDLNKEIKLKEFSIKKAIIIISICIFGSLFISYLLNLIPNQNLAFLDASSNIISICGIILMNLRYKECWIIFLFNNTIDLIIWIINTTNLSPNSIMMLISSLGYLLINIYGLIKWKKNNKLII